MNNELIPDGTQDADAPASLHSLLHAEVCKRAIHAPILAHTLLLTIATVDASPLTPLLPSVCKEQTHCTLRECTKRHPRVFPCKCQEWRAHRVLRRAEQRVRLF